MKTKILPDFQICISVPLSFPDLLKSALSDDDYEDVLYDVESLFTSIPVQETIDYILYKIYVKKELNPFCKKVNFQKSVK